MTKRTLWPLAACIVASTHAQWADLTAATDAGYVTVWNKPLHRDDGRLIERRTLQRANGPSMRLIASRVGSGTEIDAIWLRFEAGFQLQPVGGVRSLKFRYSLGDRLYVFDRGGSSGWRLLCTLGKGYVDLMLDLPGSKTERGMVFEPNDVDRDQTMFRQVAARTLANIAARELEDASADPATGAGRYSRPDGVRFVELTPWAKARGYSARLNDDGISVTLAKGDRSVVVNLACKDAVVDGTKRTLAECPLWKEGRFLVAEKDLAKLF